MQYRQGIVSQPPTPEASTQESNTDPTCDVPSLDMEETLDRAEEDTL